MHPGSLGLQGTLNFHLKDIFADNVLLCQNVVTSLVAPSLVHNQPGGVSTQMQQNQSLQILC